jgi:DNA-binding response OmpR family regulator
MTELSPLWPDSKLNLYFIDDSATMREVVKIAFRRENFNVVTCADTASAVAQFDQTAPDVVISDVIMPDQDGYQFCQFMKQHPRFSAVPVLLMSGVVNPEVAEKANDAKADELIRKPFHPQDLVERVKKLMNIAPAVPPAAPSPAPAGPTFAQGSPLGRLFEAPAPRAPQAAPVRPPAPESASSKRQPVPPVQPPTSPSSPARAGASNSQELTKLRNEVRRLESLVRKLQSDLTSEREYSASLEEQLRTHSTAE